MVAAPTRTLANSVTAKGSITRSVAIVTAILCAAIAPAWGATAMPDEGPLRVGAAKIDITPSAKELPKSIEDVHDHVFVRAIVPDNGHSPAALVTVDTGAIGTETWSNVAQRLEKALGIPVAHFLLTATHTHSAPTLTNGVAPSGYIPNDAAFSYNTFEVFSSHLESGCAESAIVNGLLDLADQSASRDSP
jgi:hypothetical protein